MSRNVLLCARNITVMLNNPWVIGHRTWRVPSLVLSLCNQSLCQRKWRDATLIKGWIFHLEAYASYPVLSEGQKLNDQIPKLFHWQWLRGHLCWHIDSNQFYGQYGQIYKMQFVFNSLCFVISGWFFGTRTFWSQNWTQFIHYDDHALIWFTRQYFKSPIKSPMCLAQTSYQKVKRKHCRATRTLATRGSSESNTRSMRVFFFKTAGLSCSQRKEWSM